MTLPVRFLFDYASPWAYPASETVGDLLPGLAVDYEPVYLRGLESFAERMPYGPNKPRYIRQDVARCLAHHGLPSQVPARSPINGLYALRGALVAKELGCFDVYHTAVMRGAWAQSRDISEPEPLLDVIRDAGLDAKVFGDRIAADDVKQTLRSQTERAAAAGVFGVPSFFVGDELYWGHDRLDYVRRAVAASS